MKTKRRGSSTERCTRETEKQQDLPASPPPPRSLLSLILFHCFRWGGGNKRILGERWEQDREEERRLTFEGIKGFVLEQSEKAIWQMDSGKLTILLCDARIVERRSDLEKKTEEGSVNYCCEWDLFNPWDSQVKITHTCQVTHSDTLWAWSKDGVFIKLPTPTCLLS